MCLTPLYANNTNNVNKMLPTNKWRQRRTEHRNMHYTDIHKY